MDLEILECWGRDNWVMKHLSLEKLGQLPPKVLAICVRNNIAKQYDFLELSSLLWVQTLGTVATDEETEAQQR